MKVGLTAVACALMLSAVPAAATPVTTREVTVDYQGANTYEDGRGSMTLIGHTVKPQTGERFVSVSIEDAAGQPVLAELHQGNTDLTNRFCGETPEPVKLYRTAALHVHLYAGADCDGVSLPTQGTITFSFRR